MTRRGAAEACPDDDDATVRRTMREQGADARPSARVARGIAIRDEEVRDSDPDVTA